jgi:DNA-binding FadR family transcriptional regulator
LLGLLQPTHQVSSGQAVLKALSDFIVRSGLTKGDALPAERDLAGRLGVSRATIREALVGWEALGIVKRQQGRGTFLIIDIGSNDLHAPITLRLERQALLYILELRRVLETECVRLAAVRADDADIAKIERCLLAAEEMYAKYGIAVAEDRAFHLAVFEASHNPVFGQIYESVINRFNDEFNANDANPFIQPYTDGSQPMHRLMFEAIRRRDPDAAAAAARGIVDYVETEIRGRGGVSSQANHDDR